MAEQWNGADVLCQTLLTNGVDVCFANPGTSEMNFVAALDRQPKMKCVLGLSESVVTGAADGYGRMADKPASTLLHLGPGLANGLANLHNARRARTPLINIVGDHATYHLAYDAPLTSDIEGLARPMSHWVGRAEVGNVRQTTERALTAARMSRGVATMILPADVAWTPANEPAREAVTAPLPPKVSATSICEAGVALRSGRRCALILAGQALRADALHQAGRISQTTGAKLFSQTSGRTERGAGRIRATPIPYRGDAAVRALADIEVAICIGGKPPVAFFAYPDKPSTFLPPHCAVIELAAHEHDLHETLLALATEVGAGRDVITKSLGLDDIQEPTGALTADTIAMAIARRLPENAIIVEEALTSAGRFAELAPTLKPHDHLALTGGAIGEGIPLAIGAGIACPGRKIIALQADGSGMYTAQGLWTQARENLDVVTIVYSNRQYAILQHELRAMGIDNWGLNAERMLSLDNPAIDWTLLARGLGVEPGKADTIEEFCRLLDAALRQSGPFLIEAVI